MDCAPSIQYALPDEIVIKIFGYLPPYQRLLISNVNRRCRQIAADDKLKLCEIKVNELNHSILSRFKELRAFSLPIEASQSCKFIFQNQSLVGFATESRRYIFNSETEVLSDLPLSFVDYAPLSSKVVALACKEGKVELWDTNLKSHISDLKLNPSEKCRYIEHMRLVQGMALVTIGQAKKRKKFYALNIIDQNSIKFRLSKDYELSNLEYQRLKGCRHNNWRIFTYNKKLKAVETFILNQSLENKSGQDTLLVKDWKGQYRDHQGHFYKKLEILNANDSWVLLRGKRKTKELILFDLIILDQSIGRPFARIDSYCTSKHFVEKVILQKDFVFYNKPQSTDIVIFSIVKNTFEILPSSLGFRFYLLSDVVLSDKKLYLLRQNRGRIFFSCYHLITRTLVKNLS